MSWVQLAKIEDLQANSNCLCLELIETIVRLFWLSPFLTDASCSKAVIACYGTAHRNGTSLIISVAQVFPNGHFHSHLPLRVKYIYIYNHNIMCIYIYICIHTYYKSLISPNLDAGNFGPQSLSNSFWLIHLSSGILLHSYLLPSK